jgi:ankyrin repeat protein
VNGSYGHNRFTPLMCAMMSVSLETVAILLEHRADIGAKNANGSTALLMGIEHGAPLKTIGLLLTSGAGTQIDTPNESGYTPRDMAVEKGRDEIVRLFSEFPRA